MVLFLVPVVRRPFVPVVRVLVLEPGLRAVPPLFLAAVPVFTDVRDAADVERLAVERFAVDRLAVDRLAVDRLAVERLALDFPVERPLVLPAVLFAAPAPDADSSIGHLPVITRSAASATASAMSEPSRVALVITEFAAWLAVSAASMPASLIALRAFGLALIAAAAAARPAASISLLIAALAILSTVVSFDFDDDFDDPLLFLDFAIANLPSVVQ